MANVKPIGHGATQTETFLQTGPGAAAGDYMRRFWQPIYHSADLAPGRAVPLRIMGKNFTLYRGESGRLCLTDPRCPHRGTQLSTGWVEGEQLSCRYHGWTFDPDGAQAAADSTRSSTTLDTGSSVNPRTARRLVTASYTSMMIASLPPAIRFVQTHAVVSFGPNPTSGQYSHGPGTQRKTSPATATWQTDGNDR